jgi:protein-tyrosine phosphatase
MQLLVVCTANIARSPLAASMLAASLVPSGIDVVSAGTLAQPGHPAADSSQVQAERRGLDLGGHRSQPVTPELLRDADLVLTMSERHREQCVPLGAGPEARARVFTLREIVRLVADVDRSGAPPDVSSRITWLAEQAHQARPTAPPPGAPEDVHDPIRDPEAAWVAMAATLDELCSAVLEVLDVAPGWTPAPSAPTDDDRPGGRRRLPGWLGGAAP